MHAGWPGRVVDGGYRLRLVGSGEAEIARRMRGCAAGAQEQGSQGGSRSSARFAQLSSSGEWKVSEWFLGEACQVRLRCFTPGLGWAFCILAEPAGASELGALG